MITNLRWNDNQDLKQVISDCCKSDVRAVRMRRATGTFVYRMQCLKCARLCSIFQTAPEKKIDFEQTKFSFGERQVY